MHDDHDAAPLTGGPRPAPSPFGALPEPAPSPFGSPFGGAPASSPFGGGASALLADDATDDAPTGAFATSTFSGEAFSEDAFSEDALVDDDLVSAVFATTAPSAAAAAAAPAPVAPFGTSPAAPAPRGPAGTSTAPGLSAASLFGAPSAAASAVPGVPSPRAAADGEVATRSTAGAARERRPVNPLLAVAVGGAAVLAGGLVALTLLVGSGDDVATGTVAVPSRPSATASASPTATAGTSGPAAGVFAPNARDPFLPLVGAPAGGSPSSTASAVPTGASTLPATGGTTSGTTTGGTTGGTGTTAGGTTGGTGTTAGGATGTATQLTKAQVCTAVTDPMNQVEQLLTASSTGASGAVDAGLALRNPVAVLRTAVSLTSDSRLAGRLDIAASTAEALRAQLIAGTAATAGQVATQVSRDADVRAACA